MKTIQTIKNIIDSGDFKQFIGMKESLHFEAKQSPYKLNKKSEQFELAKDVSAMANASGGYIIIGLKTEKMKSEKVDFVKSLKLVKKEQFSIEQYESTIKDYLYPNMRGNFKVGWKEFDKKGEGIGFICIEKRKSEIFLIAHEYVKDEKLKHISFGYAERKESESTPLPIHRIHQDIKRGRSKTADKLAEISKKLDNLLTKTGVQKGASPIDEIQNKIKEIEK